MFPNHIGIYPGTEEPCFETRLDAIPKDHKAIIGRVTIPKEVKARLLDDLKLMGISKETMFADNVDTVCESIVADCVYRITGDKKWM